MTNIEHTRNWRGGSVRTLNTRSIYKSEFPKLINAMKEDGLVAIITSDGVIWYHGAYRLTGASVRFVWNLTIGQYRRIVDYILVNDPFSEGL